MRKKTTTEFVLQLKQKNPSIKVLEEYTNSRTRLRVKGVNCGHEWMALPHDLIQGHSCPICRYINNSNRTRKTNEQFLIELSRINPNIEPLESYQTSQIRIRVRCKICGNEWLVKPNSLLRGDGCAKCAGLKKKSTAEFTRELSTINPNIRVIGEYNGNNKGILVQCCNCETKWSPTPKSLLRGSRCPYCSIIGTSFMEQFIRAAFSYALGKENVVSRDRTAIGSELDIYIPTLSLAIEPGSWFWHQEHVARDLAKRELAQKNGIRLITIYDTFPAEGTPPFEKDCFVFEGQLNEPGLERLKQLVLRLFELTQLRIEFSNDQWASIISDAHNAVAHLSHDKFVEQLASINPTIELLSRYNGPIEKVTVKCIRCGHVWDTMPSRLLKKANCRSCLGLKPYTTLEFSEKVHVANPSIVILGEYINANTKIQVKSLTCGHDWFAWPQSLLRGNNCPYCASNRKKTQDEFINELNEINPSIEVVGEYINANTPILVRCKNCKREYLTRPSTLLHGHGCSVCNIKKSVYTRTGKTHRKTPQEFAKAFALLHPKLELLSEYTKSKERVHVRCRTCNHEWTPTAGSLLSGHGCPNCARTRLSKQ